MLQFLKNLQRAFMPSPDQLRANALYNTAVAQSRQPGFYLAGGVPDTIDGRFDMIVLHAFLIMRRLRDGGPDGEALSQALFDEMFADMDRSLREMGVGDMSVGKHIKRMVKAFYGRAAAYEEGLDGNDDALERALAANLFRNVNPPRDVILGIGSYLRRASAYLATQPVIDIEAGQVDLGVPPALQRL